MSVDSKFTSFFGVFGDIDPPTPLRRYRGGSTLQLLIKTEPEYVHAYEISLSFLIIPNWITLRKQENPIVLFCLPEIHMKNFKKNTYLH